MVIKLNHCQSANFDERTRRSDDMNKSTVTTFHQAGNAVKFPRHY